VTPPHRLHSATPAELQARLAAERRQQPFLLFRDGGGLQRIVELGDAPERLVIGRAPSNDIVLGWDGEVSRVHATLERLGAEWTLVDDGRARNGSFVEGRRVQGRRRLHDGDTILLGRTAIAFRSPTGHESLRTATSPEAAARRISAAQLRVLTALCRPYAASDYAAPASNAEIAQELVLGAETVKTHMRALFEAFEVGDVPHPRKRAALAARALEEGFVSLRDLRA
jgi:pSer/pThr/pTyr-binding forkhead associated (FHA) protein